MRSIYRPIKNRKHPPGWWAFHDRCALAAAQDLSRFNRDQAAALLGRFVAAAATAHRLPDEELEAAIGEDIERARNLLLRSLHPMSVARHADISGGANDV